MGKVGMRFSLQSRELIADSIETATVAHHHDACIAIPGCDKNMPGVIMGMTRHNRPSMMIYGGSIDHGYSKSLKKKIYGVSVIEAHGAYLYDKLSNLIDPSQSKDEILDELIRDACPGQGACGGMFTANTMAMAIETMDLSIPGYSSLPATSPEKMRECKKAAEALKICIERDIRPKDCLTKASFENALVMLMALGGSTNGVLHLLAMAGTASVDLSLDDFQRVSNKVPFIANLYPSGKYLMVDLYDIGGIPFVQKFLIAAQLMDGSTITVTGKTLAEYVESSPGFDVGQDVIRPLSNPLKPSGHIEILYGNLAPEGAVAKITGKQGLKFVGKARVFNKEQELNDALSRHEIPSTENLVLLKASAAIIGADLRNVSLITNGRYSGASHGFIVGHMCPEAAVGGPIAVVQYGDTITIDAVKNTVNMDVEPAEIQGRLAEWEPPRGVVKRGVLAKYARLVGDASYGAMTDVF